MWKKLEKNAKSWFQSSKLFRRGLCNALRCYKRTIGLHHLGKLERKHMEQGQGIIPTVLSDYYVSYSSNSFLPEPQVNWDVR